MPNNGCQKLGCKGYNTGLKHSEQKYLQKKMRDCYTPKDYFKLHLLKAVLVLSGNFLFSLTAQDGGSKALSIEAKEVEMFCKVPQGDLMHLS